VTLAKESGTDSFDPTAVPLWGASDFTNPPGPQTSADSRGCTHGCPPGTCGPYGSCTIRRQVGFVAETSRQAHVKATRNAASAALADSIVAILTTCGLLTDDEICARYAMEGGTLSPQNVRTVRATLARTGVLRAAGMGRSALGNPAQTWALA
jgi:hypothetical protein